MLSTLRTLQQNFNHRSYEKSLHVNFLQIISKKKTDLVHLKESLEAISPRKILSKGYAIVFNEKTNSVILNPEQTNLHDKLSIRLAKGTIKATVVNDETKDR